MTRHQATHLHSLRNYFIIHYLVSLPLNTNLLNMKPAFSLLIILHFIIGSSTEVKGQIQYFGNLYSKPVLLNHAYAGSNNAPRLTASALFLKDDNETDLFQYYFSYDMAIKSSGISLQFMQEQYHYFYSGPFLITYSHKFTINDKLALCPALTIGSIYKKINYKKLGIDSYYYPGQPSPNYPDIAKGNMFTSGISFLALYGDFTAGFNIDQLNSPRLHDQFLSESRSPQYLVHTEYKFKSKGNTQIIPGLIFYSNKYYSNKLDSYLIPSFRLNTKYVELGVIHRLPTKRISSMTTLSLGLNFKWVNINYSHNIYEKSNYFRLRHEFTITASLKELKR